MKKSFLISLFLLFALNSAWAQQTESTKIQPLVTSDVPTEVLAAVESDYPGMNIRNQLYSPAGPSMRELKRQLQDKNVPEYCAVVRGRQYRKTASYNKNGELISSTERIKNAAVPHAVLAAIGREYNGWLVTKNLTTRIKAGTYNSVSYKVWLKKGRKKQRITIDATGKILAKKRAF